MREYQTTTVDQSRPIGSLLLQRQLANMPGSAVRDSSEGFGMSLPCGSPRSARSILQMQRTYGNHYVQRTMALARRGEGEGEVTPEVESTIERSRGGGQGLDHGVRRQMESAFGADFGGVRVHTGAQAHELNRAVSAIAFTTGQDIFFREGAYSPGTSGGNQLLAHELTHVVQQGGASFSSGTAQRFQIQRVCAECEEEKKGVQRKLAVGQADDRYEREADQIAGQVVRAIDGTASSQSQALSHQAVGLVQRPCACGGHSDSRGPCAECRKHATEDSSGGSDARCHIGESCDADDLFDHQGSGLTTCNKSTGNMETTLTEHCAGDCVAQHEAVHRVDRGECCKRVKKCRDSAPDAAGRASCDAAFATWFPTLSDFTECNAYTREVGCLTAFIAGNCDGHHEQATSDAAAGGIVGGVLGGIGGLLLGGPAGAVEGATGGAAAGAAIGFAAGKVSPDCCNTLKNELAFAKTQKSAHCAAAVNSPCPFQSDGSII